MAGTTRPKFTMSEVEQLTVATESPKSEETPVPGDDTVEIAGDGSVVIHLTMPLKPVNGGDLFSDLEKLTVRQMYAKDLIAMDQVEGEIARTMAMAREWTGLPSAALDRLHPDDFVKLFGLVQGRLGKFLATSGSYSHL